MDVRRVFDISRTKAHVETIFTRYRDDWSVLAQYESLYLLTFENGRWGVRMRSSYAG